MKTKHYFSILLILLLITTLVGCGESEKNDIVLESKDSDSTITVSGGAFNIGVDDCIDVLNNDIKEKGLQPISEKYDTISKGGITLYRSKIDDNLELRLYEFPNTNNAISVIQFARTDDFENPDKDEAQISDEEKARSLEYYKSLTKCVDQRFNVDPFMRTGEPGQKEYTLDGITYLYLSYNQELTENREQTIRLYGVTTNPDFYDKYSNLRTDLVIELFNKDNNIKDF